jgi:hypothetical protein
MYVLIRADSAKCTVFAPSPVGSCAATGMLEMALQCAGTVACQV